MRAVIHWQGSFDTPSGDTPSGVSLRRLSGLLLIAGSLLLLYCAMSVFETAWYQSFSVLPATLPAPSAGLPAPPRLRFLALEGAPMSRMEVPRLGLSVLVAEGTSSHTLKRGAGHISGTAFPDETGNVGIAGHRDTVFRKLRAVRRGDIVTLTTPASLTRYQVQWTRIVEPTDTNVIQDSGDSQLTLVTCYPFYYVGPSPKRFVVRAIRLSDQTSP